MEMKEMVKKIDHTQLKAFATWEDIVSLCDEAILYQTASVCVPPAYVKAIKDKYGEQLKICTVIGFPLGYNTTIAKNFEAIDAIKNGADEIDMVINIGMVKNGRYDEVFEEIKKLRGSTQGHILKVIIETCYLTEEEKIELCKIVTRAGADYIKTSTGFGTNGATKEDIELFKANIGSEVKMKAAGGIRTKEALTQFVELGCDRIGSSFNEVFS